MRGLVLLFVQCEGLCPREWVPFGSRDRCAKIFRYKDYVGHDRGTWSEALDFCVKSGALLATTRHKAETRALEFLLSDTTSASDSAAGCWVGLRRSLDETASNYRSFWIDSPSSEGRLSETDDLKDIRVPYTAFLRPSERCAYVNKNGIGDRPCFGSLGKLRCFVCASIGTDADVLARQRLTQILKFPHSLSAAGLMGGFPGRQHSSNLDRLDYNKASMADIIMFRPKATGEMSAARMDESSVAIADQRETDQSMPVRWQLAARAAEDRFRSVGTQVKYRALSTSTLAPLSTAVSLQGFEWESELAFRDRFDDINQPESDILELHSLPSITSKAYPLTERGRFSTHHPTDAVDPYKRNSLISNLKPSHDGSNVSQSELSANWPFAPKWEGGSSYQERFDSLASLGRVVENPSTTPVPFTPDNREVSRSRALDIAAQKRIAEQLARAYELLVKPYTQLLPQSYISPLPQSHDAAILGAIAADSHNFDDKKASDISRNVLNHDFFSLPASEPTLSRKQRRSTNAKDRNETAAEPLEVTRMGEAKDADRISYPQRLDSSFFNPLDAGEQTFYAVSLLLATIAGAYLMRKRPAFLGEAGAALQSETQSGRSDGEDGRSGSVENDVDILTSAGGDADVRSRSAPLVTQAERYVRLSRSEEHLKMNLR